MGAVLFALAVFCMRLLVPNLFVSATAPFLRASSALGFESHAFFSQFSDRVTLTERNEELTAQNELLATENAMLTEKLANLGGAGAPVSGILADVAARPPVSPYDTLLLGAGEKKGVLLHMEAFGPSGTPVGVVSSVLPDFSQVTLFSAPGVLTHGSVGQSSVPVILMGAGGGALTASVPRAAHVAVGDRVFVPGPGQLPFGTVIRVDSDELSPAITLRIAASTNLFSLSSVELRSTGITGMAFSTSTLP
jgi:cell shape-determining protein MreC